VPTGETTAPGPTVTTATAAAPTGTKPTKAKVTAALLTPGELGAGYSSNNTLAGNNPAGGLNTSLKDCAEAPSDPSAVTAEQVYQGGATGPFVVETITDARADTAAALLTRLRSVKQNCHQFGGQMAGGIKLQVTIDDLTMTKVGDDMVAYRLTATVPGVGAALYAHMVTTRVGGLVVLVSLLEMSSPDVGATEKIVRDAVAKARQELA
jgi:hypothetical protein